MPDGSGGHIFSTDLTAHGAAVAKYHQAERKKANHNGGGTSHN
jgi:hypothetical protein